ncbi:unnamed protein product [Effrenium voratum]|uniref:Uncharacterized protein n=1 Tax=Effrenium voratum TaxID=2562239 RepID=A0AA36MUZ8_9DINO|nr:unnamed protein product [Effrenium voratum]CAJ1424310.1 unnamed protein product [Effrenium voratum]
MPLSTSPPKRGPPRFFEEPLPRGRLGSTMAPLFTEAMSTVRTRRGSVCERHTNAPGSPSMRNQRRMLTKSKTRRTELLAALEKVENMNKPRARVSSFLDIFEEEELRPQSRRPSSLPGGLGESRLDSQGSGLGFFQDKWKDLETAVQPQLRNRAYTEELRRDLLVEFDGKKEMGQAVKAGYITEDFSRLVYDKFKNEDEPAFLHDLHLEACGGIVNVAEIPLTEKYFWFIVLLVSVAFNVCYLVHLDWNIFKTYFLEVFGTVNLRLIADRLQNGGGEQSKERIEAELFDDPNFKASIFGLISDHPTRMMIVNAAVMVAIWEVVWLCMQVVRILQIFYVVVCDKSEYKRYHALGSFFQRLLPQVSTFSAVKLLAHVHPSLIMHEYKIWISEWSEMMLCGHRRNTLGIIMLTFSFVLFNVCCAIASVCAFSVKMLAVSFKLVNPDVAVWLRVASILATLNQVVGAVYIERVLQERIYLFVFGGRDAIYEDDELAYRNAYETRLMKEIWTTYYKKGKWLRAIVLLATLDHYDLQYLMIEDPEEEIDLYDRLGLVSRERAGGMHDEPTRSLSAPDNLSHKKQRSVQNAKQVTENLDLPICARLWEGSGCLPGTDRVHSNPDLLETVQEVEEHHSSPVAALEEKDDEAFFTHDMLPSASESSVSATRSVVEIQVPIPAERLKLPSVDEFGPIDSEKEPLSSRYQDSPTNHTWTQEVEQEDQEEEDLDPATESSQPLLFPPQDEACDECSSRESTRSTGMAGLARALGSRCRAWGDGTDGLDSGYQPRRSARWGDGWSDSGIPMSRSGTKDSFDWDAMFSPQAKGHDMV